MTKQERIQDLEARLQEARRLHRATGLQGFRTVARTLKIQLDSLR